MSKKYETVPNEKRRQIVGLVMAVGMSIVEAARKA